MKKKYKYIVLPPDGYHQTANDTLYKSRRFLVETIENLKKFKKKEDDFLIKYRSRSQYETYNIFENSDVGYGDFIKHCNHDSIIIGPCGTALFEALINNLSFYAYDFTKASENNNMIWNNFSSMVYVAETPSQIFNNISKKNFYKKGFAKNQLLFQNSISIEKLVKDILYA